MPTNFGGGYLLKTSVILGLLALCLVEAGLCSEQLNPDLLKSVLRIETLPDQTGSYSIGSGFLLSTTGDDSGKIFLVTNKHMIGDWNYANSDIETFHPAINVFFYRSSDPSGSSYRATKIDLLQKGHLDSSRVRLHPNPKIDLVVIDVSDKVFDKTEHISYTAYAKSYLLPFSNIKSNLTDIGDEVIALGYPLGIRSLTNNYPISKIGYLASIPGEEVSIPIQVVDRKQKNISVTLDGKFLVVDGLIVNGNSGGPVVLAGGVRVRRDPATNQLQFSDKPVQNLVIGIVSLGLGGGLTAVVSSDYLIDLISPKN